MRRKIVLATVALVLAAVSAGGQGPFRTGQFWGTWVHRVEVGPGSNIPGLITLHFDGSVTGGSGLMFGGVPSSPNRYGPAHGVWQRTGWRTIGSTTMFAIFNASTGVLSGYQRNRCSLEFSQDFNTYSGTEFMETVACVTPTSCPNPLDPNLKWTPLPTMPATGYQVSAARVVLVEAGPLQP